MHALHACRGSACLISMGRAVDFGLPAEQKVKDKRNAIKQTDKDIASGQLDQTVGRSKSERRRTLMIAHPHRHARTLG